jgi:hypothetical protein
VVRPHIRTLIWCGCGPQCGSAGADSATGAT